MMQNQFSEEIPKSKKNRTVLMLSVLVGSAVLVIGVTFFYFRQSMVGPFTPVPQHSPQFNQNDTVNTLTQKSNLSFSPPVSSSPVSLESLPDFAPQLIFPEATGISMEKASFPDNKQGFLINYKTVSKLVDVYRAFIILSFADWKVAYASRANEVAFIDLSGTSSMARIILTSDGQNINVSITVINL